MKDRSSHAHLRIFHSMAAALGLLGVFVGCNFYLHEKALHENADQDAISNREQITQTTGLLSRRLAFHDFESGNIKDASSNLACTGYGGKQSLKMSPKVQFSPGLWVRFKDLNPGDSSWIRVEGMVWFSCPVSEAKCSLVATCNHNGINYKYMYIPVEKEGVKPGTWNRICLDYHIPRAPDPEDVLQAYFWYRGNGEMLVDDIEITEIMPGFNLNDRK